MDHVHSRLDHPHIRSHLHSNLCVFSRTYQKLLSYIYIPICTSRLHLYLSIHIYSNIFTSYQHGLYYLILEVFSISTEKINFTSTLYVYSEHTTTIIHFCSSISASYVTFSHTFYHIFTETFSRIYICTITRCIYIYACTYDHTCAAEALASYKRLNLLIHASTMPSFSGVAATLTPKNKEKLRERLEGHVRGMLLQTTLQ